MSLELSSRFEPIYRGHFGFGSSTTPMWQTVSTEQNVLNCFDLKRVFRCYIFRLLLCDYVRESSHTPAKIKCANFEMTFLLSICLFDHRNTQESLDRGHSSPLLPAHEPLQTSQLLTNLLMLDWNYMLEPQQLQSTANCRQAQHSNQKRPGRTDPSARPLKHWQLRAHKVKPYCCWSQVKCLVFRMV